MTGAAQGMGQATAPGRGGSRRRRDARGSQLGGAEATAEGVRSFGRRALLRAPTSPIRQRSPNCFSSSTRSSAASTSWETSPGDGHLATPGRFTIADLQRVLQNLVIGRFAMCQEAGRRMLAQGKGSIMNIGSLGQHHGSGPRTHRL